MRRLATALGVAATCALFSSAPALAGEFTASRLPKPCTETEPCRTRGKSIESEGLTGEHNQKFHFGPFEIYCAAAAHANTVGEGAITWALNPTFSTEVLFTKCLTKVKFVGFTGGLATVFNRNAETKKIEPIKIVYKNNGTAELGTGETEGEAEISSGEANFVISGKICKIDWPSQKVPIYTKPTGEYSFAKFSTAEVPAPLNDTRQFPTGFQKRLIITNNLQKMLWHFESGQCLGEGGFEEEAKKTEGNQASYVGALEEYILAGNLGYE